MLGLLNVWKESLQIFNPMSRKLLGLTFLKALLPVYRQLIIYWGWLAVILIVAMTKTVPVSMHESIFSIVSLIAQGLWFFAICLTTRPSVLPKTCSYYCRYWRHICGFAIAMIMLIGAFYGLYAVGGISVPLLSGCVFSYHLIEDIARFFQTAIYRYVGPFIVFFTLFLLDISPMSLIHKGWFSDWHKDLMIFCANSRALTMIVYNLPIVLLVASFFVLGYYGLVLAISFIDISCMHKSLFLQVIFTYMQPIPILLYTNLYVMWIHNQAELYYIQPR